MVKGNKDKNSAINNFMSRGKLEVQLNLKKEKDRDFLLQEVIPNIDILMESFRPGVMEKLGIPPAVVHDINPKIIYVRLSGYGQQPSNYTVIAGHDINYLALTGILNKFKRVVRNSAPVPPANILADFASGSLYCFNQILQALIINKPYTTVDSSLAHNTLYLSQPVLLEGRHEPESRKKNTEVSMKTFVRPHQAVYRDKEGKTFVLKPDTQVYNDGMKQEYNHDEHFNS